MVLKSSKKKSNAAATKEALKQRAEAAPEASDANTPTSSESSSISDDILSWLTGQELSCYDVESRAVVGKNG
ncbi:hypothetical protein ACU4GI_32515 [Cupriavidus basilensis]